MRKTGRISLMVFMAGWLAVVSPTSHAGNDDDPTPRKGLEPLDNAKINRVKAQAHNNLGIESTVTTTVYQGEGGGAKGCVVNIGNQVPANGAGAAGRYGPQPKQPDVIIPNGGIYNICK
jgi:hypothetical protein